MYLVIARLAQSVERQPFKLVVVGSSPTSGTSGTYQRGIMAIILAFQASDRGSIPRVDTRVYK